MNAVGIDVSKGKSMIAVMRPGKETVIEPFEIGHTDSELIDLAKLIKSLGGETRVLVLEMVYSDMVSNSVVVASKFTSITMELV